MDSFPPQRSCRGLFSSGVVSSGSSCAFLNRRRWRPLALKQTLEDNGQLAKMKAEMRAEILKALDAPCEVSRPPMPDYAYIMNELIREYLEWCGYRYSACVLTTESGIPQKPLDRTVLMEEVGVADCESSAQIPLLCSIVSTFRDRVKQNS